MIVDTGFGAIDPTIDVDSRPFWDALASDRLELPWCASCERFFFPPTESCRRCGDRDVEWRVAERGGRSYTWVTVHRSLHPAFDADVPYTIVLADLDCGVRMLGRMVDDTTLALEQRITLVPYRAGGHVLPGFVAEDEIARPIEDGAAR